MIRKTRFFSVWLVLAAGLALHGMTAQAADRRYRVVENWAQFPPGVTKWGSATGVDVDRNDNVYVLHRNETMPIMVFDRNGKFVQWWGGKGTGPGQFDVPHSIAVDSKGRIYVADRSNNRIQIFDPAGRFLTQWTNFGTPWGLFIKGDRIYVVDGTANNCLLIASIKDGKILEKIEGLNNATAVTVDSKGTIYVGEVNGTNVKKLVRQ